MAALPSTAQVNVEPEIVEENLILALRVAERFLGCLVTLVSGAGQAAWVSLDCGHRSWVRSPYWSPSTSGSRTAEMFTRLAVWGFPPGKSVEAAGSKDGGGHLVAGHPAAPAEHGVRAVVEADRQPGRHRDPRREGVHGVDDDRVLGAQGHDGPVTGSGGGSEDDETDQTRGA